MHSQRAVRLATVALESHVSLCKHCARWRESCLCFRIRVVTTSAHRLCSVVVLACVACGSSVPQPKLARQPPSEYLPVPYPPPAAFSEVVPTAPKGDALWVDGHWAWRGRTYVWQRGGWVTPPEGARFAPWHVRYTQDGTLLFADEAWYDLHLQPMPSPKALVPAFTPPNELTPESQHGF
jgi:hypothetical protein